VFLQREHLLHAPNWAVFGRQKSTRMSGITSIRRVLHHVLHTSMEAGHDQRGGACHYGVGHE